LSLSSCISPHSQQAHRRETYAFVEVVPDPIRYCVICPIFIRQLVVPLSAGVST
jgi:hypothetical protein